MKHIIDIVNDLDVTTRALAMHSLRAHGCGELAEALGMHQAHIVPPLELAAALEKANDRVARLEGTIAKMRASVTAGRGERDDAVEAVGKLQAELVQANERIAGLEAALTRAQIP